jgi:usherin
VRTLESLPAGQQAPTVAAVNFSALSVAWEPPAQPNGEITAYRLEARRGGSGLAFVLVFEGLARAFVHGGLEPNTVYEFVVRAINRAGQATSPAASGLTLSGNPEGVGTANVSNVTARSARFAWRAPARPNGVITQYRLLLLAPETMVVSEALVLSANASGLTPATTYLAQLEAVTNGGSGSGPSFSFTTLPAAPEEVAAPELVTSGATFLVLSWAEPGRPNGAITLYRLRQTAPEAMVVFVGSAASVNVTGLKAYTTYTFVLEACTAGGCAVGPASAAATSEGVPPPVDAPQLEVLSATRIRARWTAVLPAQVRVLYALERTDLVTGVASVVYRDTATEFTDAGLLPFREYSYRVDSITDSGSQASAAARARTLQAAPASMPAPTVNGTDSISVTVSWPEPAQPNGIITRYIVYGRAVQTPPLEATTVCFCLFFFGGGGGARPRRGGWGGG